MKRGLIALTTALALLAPTLSAAKNRAYAVEIRVHADPSLMPRVRAAAEELSQRLHVEAHVQTAREPSAEAEPANPLIIATFDFRDPSTPSVVIEDGSTHEPLTQRSLTEVASFETAIETLVHVLYLALESLLQVEASASNPAPTAQPTPTKIAPTLPTERALLGLDIGPLLRLSSLGASRLAPGGGLSLEPRAALGWGHAGLWVSGALGGMAELDTGQAQRPPVELRLIPTLDFPISSLVGCFGLGAGLDSLQIETVRVSGARRLVTSESSFSPIASGMLGARFPLAGNVFLSALATLDLNLAPTSALPGAGAGTPAIATAGEGPPPGSAAMPRFRGGLTLALSFTAAGSGRFANSAERHPTRLDAENMVTPQRASAKQ